MSRKLTKLMNMKNRTVLITGGAGHIGREAAEAVAELGAKVALADLDGDACWAVAADIARKKKAEVQAFTVDVADEEAVRTLPRRVKEAFGSVDVLINTAAFVGTTGLEGWVVPFAEQTLGTWRQALEVNLTAAFSLVQAAAPHLRENGHGSVIILSSIYGLVGPDLRLYEGTAMGNPAAYAAAKGGLIQLTRWLSTVMAPDVRVNALTPGGIWRNQPDSFVERYTERVPLGRMASEEDLKGAIAYLSSDLSSYVTGQNLIVDGGWTAW